MEATSGSGAEPSPADWLAGAVVEFGGDFDEQVQLPSEGAETGDDEIVVA